MLPSTFFQRTYDNAYLQRKLVAKQELAKFFQESIEARTKYLVEKKQSDLSVREKAEALYAFQTKLLAKDQTDVNPFLSLDETLQFSKLFKKEFIMEKMPIQTLQLICKLLGIKPYKTHTHVLLQLRRHLNMLQREDREIMWEGVQALSEEELIEACKERGMLFYGISPSQMRQLMSSWLELSSHRDIPPLLLLWSRCISMTHYRASIDASINGGEEEEEASPPRSDVQKEAPPPAPGVVDLPEPKITREEQIDAEEEIAREIKKAELLEANKRLKELQEAAAELKKSIACLQSEKEKLNNNNNNSSTKPLVASDSTQTSSSSKKSDQT